jgi:hypothetical protein
MTRLRSNRSLTAPVSGPSKAGVKSPASSNSATTNACSVVSAT